jgi:hypothetical protein
MHRLAIGVHTPAHAPVVALQTKGQAAPPFTHCALLLQVCGWSPLHFTAFGVQTPVQAPALQRKGQAAAIFCQVPVASQVCG